MKKEPRRTLAYFESFDGHLIDLSGEFGCQGVDLGEFLVGLGVLGAAPAFGEEFGIVCEEVEARGLEESRLADVKAVVAVAELDDVVAGVTHASIVPHGEVLPKRRTEQRLTQKAHKYR